MKVFWHIIFVQYYLLLQNSYFDATVNLVVRVLDYVILEILLHYFERESRIIMKDSQFKYYYYSQRNRLVCDISFVQTQQPYCEFEGSIFYNN